MTTPSGEPPPWGLLSKHARLLGLVAQQPEVLIRDLAARMGTTERTAHLILSELVDSGVLVRTRVGRRNHYRFAQPDRPDVRLKLHGELQTMCKLLDALGGPPIDAVGHPESLGA